MEGISTDDEEPSAPAGEVRDPGDDARDRGLICRTAYVDEKDDESAHLRPSVE